jgi:hypothetical protein
MAEKKPDLKTFIEDPQFQGDRDLLDGYFEHFLTRKAKEADEKKAADDAKKPKSIFDVIFGGE